MKLTWRGLDTSETVPSLVFSFSDKILGISGASLHPDFSPASLSRGLLGWEGEGSTISGQTMITGWDYQGKMQFQSVWFFVVVVFVVLNDYPESFFTLSQPVLIQSIIISMLTYFCCPLLYVPAPFATIVPNSLLLLPLSLLPSCPSLSCSCSAHWACHGSRRGHKLNI